MLNLDWATLLFQIVNFLVLLWLLNRFLFRPLREKLGERRQTISDTLQNARDQEVEAAQLRQVWEERQRMAELQAEEILQNAQREAEERRAQLLQEARIQLDRLTEEMRSDLERQRNELIVRHYDDILDAIINLSGNVVQSVTTRRTHDDLVTNFAASIYQLPQTEVEEYRRIMAGRVPTAFVTTPVALTAEQTKTLTDTLSSLIDRRVELQVRIDPDLVAGIQVRLADRLIDNSVRHQLNRIRDRVRQDLITRMGATS
ncbi:MAG: F0F1 ATP synthase subunit delta [Chloroflexi bacterium]|nr:F0F1 ATP synthase subunit delta [Chloroflexota bacterium]